MALDKIKTVGDILDVVMKGAITFAVAAGTLIFNSMKGDIEANRADTIKIQERAAAAGERTATLEAWAKSSDQRMDRLEKMTSEILTIARANK